MGQVQSQSWESSKDKFNLVNYRQDLIKTIKQSGVKIENAYLYDSFDLDDKGRLKCKSSTGKCEECPNEEILKLLKKTKSGVAATPIIPLEGDELKCNEYRCDYALSVKIVPFDKPDDIDILDPQRLENIEEIVHFMMYKDFVVRKVTPHIVTPVMSFSCLPQSVGDQTLIQKPSKIFIREHMEKGNCKEFLKDFARESGGNLDQVLRSLLFQVIYTLSAIQNRYPSFRHTQCNLEAWKVRKIGTSKEQNYIAYRIGDVYYAVPNLGWQVGLSDFGCSNMEPFIRPHTPCTPQSSYYSYHVEHPLHDLSVFVCALTSEFKVSPMMSELLHVFTTKNEVSSTATLAEYLSNSIHSSAPKTTIMGAIKQLIQPYMISAQQYEGMGESIVQTYKF
jgi:hypothetical protein